MMGREKRTSSFNWTCVNGQIKSEDKFLERGKVCAFSTLDKDSAVNKKL